jgi:plasmid stabilization system protein ParE
MSVEWSDLAIEELEGAASWLEERNPRAARELIEAVGDRAAILAAGRARRARGQRRRWR